MTAVPVTPETWATFLTQLEGLESALADLATAKNSVTTIINDIKELFGK